MPAQDGLIVFRKKFGLKKVKITGETASAHQEAANEFPDAIMKIVDEKDICLYRFLKADKRVLLWKKWPQKM